MDVGEKPDPVCLPPLKTKQMPFLCHFVLNSALSINGIRRLPDSPGDWVLNANIDADHRYGVVRVEWPSYTSL